MQKPILKSISLFKKLFVMTFLVAVLPLGFSWMYFFYIENHGGESIFLSSSVVFYGLLVFALVVAAAGAFLFSKKIVRPIKQYIRSATEIARGNFSHKVQVVSNDEIGRLARMFNYMAEEVKRLNERNLHKIISEKNKTETILGNIADGVILADSENRVQLVNHMAEDWFQLGGKRVENEPLENVIQNSRLIKFIRKFTKNGDKRIQSLELSVTPRSGGKELVLQARAARITDRKNNLMGIVTVLRDITREKEIDRMKTDLVSMVAHELRSPLTSISGFSELLLDPSTSRSQSGEYASIILKESNRLSELINKFLDISKIEAGKSQVRRSPVDMKFLVEKVLEFNSQLAKKKQIAVELEVPHEVSSVYVDRDMMEQVILNLYSNAIKYSPDNASVTVRILDREEDLKVDFEDTGYGISEKALPHVFDKFYRVSDNEHISEIGGSGLGLSLVKEIIEIHGGSISVRSTVGVGSTFSFTLPKMNGAPVDQTEELALWVNES